MQHQYQHQGTLHQGIWILHQDDHDHNDDECNTYIYQNQSVSNRNDNDNNDSNNNNDSNDNSDNVKNIRFKETWSCTLPFPIVSLAYGKLLGESNQNFIYVSNHLIVTTTVLIIILILKSILLLLLILICFYYTTFIRKLFISLARST